MIEKEIIELIKDCLKKTEVNLDGILLDNNTDLLAEGILDSLDAMTFLFHIEKKVGKKITEIDDEFEDFRISSLLSILSKY